MRILVAAIKELQDHCRSILAADCHRNIESYVSHRAFSKPEAERRQQHVVMKRSSTSPTGHCFVMNNNTAIRYEEGYLIREIPIKSLNVEEATPPVAELQAFNQVSAASQFTGFLSSHGVSADSETSRSKFKERQ